MASQTAELQGAAGCGMMGHFVRLRLTPPRPLTLIQTLVGVTPVARGFRASFS